MAGSFAKLRAAQSSTDVLASLQTKSVNESKKGGAPLDDETYLDISHVRDKDGKGTLRGRFLPALENDEPWVTYVEYQFQGPGGWYIQKSRKSLGKDEKDPVFEYNGTIFADKSLSDDERKKKLLGRREFFVANFLVLKDKNKPENEGKVFKWKFGPQINNLVKGAMAGKAADEADEDSEAVAPFNPFDPFEGKDFILRVTTKLIGTKEVPSYETSGFAKNPSSVVDNPDDFDEIWARQYPLKPIVAEKEFKSYEELVTQFTRAMGTAKKNFLDSDEPLNRSAEPAKKETKAAKKSTEVLNDSIPGVQEDEQVDNADAGTTDSTGDDDWFNALKK